MAVPAENKVSASRGKKSAAAFRTISEVAAELDLPQHVLRFWETKFSSVKPLKRGGGRRYYRPEDVALLKHIRELLYVEGYTIKGVQKLLNKSTPTIISADETAKSKKQPIAAVAPVQKADSVALDPQIRQTLQTLLTELEELRALLGNPPAK
ncbi:MAG: MerR family transcriptional regulator [Rhodospirillaceae bacterium]|jgi:DNA-binding transcriptional MerR regulator